MMMVDSYPYYFKILTITPPKVKFLTFGGTLYFRIKRFLSLKAAETKIMKKQITKWSIALVFFLQILLGNFVSGQNGIIGAGFTNGWGTGDIIGFDAGQGSSRIKILNPKGTGDQYFRLVRNWSSDLTQFGPASCIDVNWTNPGVIYGATTCNTAGAFIITCPNITDNYVFKTPNGSSTMDLLYFRVQGAVRSVSSVAQSPAAISVAANMPVTITATLDGALNTGQAVYLRYTSNGFTNSTVVQLTGSGTTYTGQIPGNASGAGLSYYVFTSGTNNVASDGSNADLFTININNNGGSNYGYTVALATYVVTVTSTGGAGATGAIYTTLKGAFDAINAGTHTGTITVSINGNTTETASAVLNASGTGSALYTAISIQSAGGGARTVSGAIATDLISLNGADNVTINGLNSGGNSLLFENTTAGLTSTTIKFIGDASSNTITNCTIRGAQTASGTIFFSTGTATGNDNNIISNNTIASSTSGTTFAVNAILSTGTSAAIDNSSNSITGNNIQDYFSATLVTAGINLTATGNGNSAWTITNNKLFQTATRLYTGSNTHYGIFIGVGSGYTISGNTIGFANSAGTGTTNMVGNSVALTGFPTSFTATGTATATRYIAINGTFTAGGTNSVIKSNTIAGFALHTSSGAGGTNGVLCGINVLAGNATIGGTLSADGNIIGTTTGPTVGTYSIFTSATGAGSVVAPIYATSANTVSIQNNKIGDIMSTGATVSTAAGFKGIDVAGAGNFSITDNIIGNNQANNIRAGYYLTTGNLSNSATTATTATGGSVVTGILSAATGNTLVINTNTIKGIQISGSVTTNTAIRTSGTMTGTTPSINVNSNAIGTATLGWVTYAVANGGVLVGISNAAATATTSLSVTGNDVRGITHSVAGSNAHTYIINSGATLSQNISSNTFTNLNVNTTGSVTFINNSVTVPATGTQTISSNSIGTAFSKGGAGGTITLCTSSASSVSGATINHNSNNFSNITVTGATIIAGWISADGGTANKTYNGNTFSNWTGGSSSITAMICNFGGGVGSNGNVLSNNTITNLTGTLGITGIILGGNGTTYTANNNTITGLSSTGAGGAVTGIASAAPTGNIFLNTINTLSSTSTTATVAGITSSGVTANIYQNNINTLSRLGTTSGATNGIMVTAGTTVNVYANKVHDLSTSGAFTTTPGVNGMVFSAGTTVQAYNNLIGDLRAPAANFTDAIRGISVTSGTASSNYRIYNNTIYLNATSSGGTFGTTGIFHTASATATTAALDLRNNMVFNTSTPNGAGVVTALRRFTIDLGNYATTSNNNLYYAGSPAANRTIMTDGTNLYQTMATFQPAVAPTREAASFSESAFVPASYFTSTTGSNANYLKPATGLATQAESGGQAIALTSPDYGAVIRPASSGANFDCGAWEFAGVSPAPVITFTSATPATTAQCTKAARAVVVAITTPSGTISGANLNYNHNGVAQTAIVMTNTSGTTWTGTMLAPTTGNAPVTWTVVATNSIGISTTYTGTAFADEPLMGATATATASVNPVCAGSSTSLSVLVTRNSIVTLGAGGLTSTSAPFNPFNGGYGGMKGTYLIRASELTALGLTAGNFTSIALDFSAIGATYNGFVLSVGNTSLTALTSSTIASGLTTVFTAASVTPTVGINTYTLSTPFNWNGTSNIIISTSWSNANASNTSATIKYDATSFQSSVSYRKDNETAVNLSSFTGATGAGTFWFDNSSNRPKFLINGNTAPTPSAYSWSDGATTVGTSNPFITSPTANTSYTATATISACPLVSNTLAVTVNSVTASPTNNTTSIQCGTVATFGITTSVTSPTIRWYTASTGGSAIVGESSTTMAVTGLSAGAVSRWATVTDAGGCESARVECTLTLSGADPLMVAVSPVGNICLGSPINLSVTQTGSNNTYTLTWQAAGAGSGLVSNNTSGSLSLTVTPTAIGTYTYQINGLESSSGCAASSSVVVIVAATATTGLASAVAATTATVAGSIIANCGIIPIYGIEYSTVNNFVNGAGTQVASSNQASGSYTASLTGLTNNTIYYYKAYATYGLTTVYGTQSTFTTPQLCNIALQETFPTTTTPAGWGLTSFAITSAVTGVPAAFTSNYMRVNLDGSPNSANFTTCNYGPVGANANLTFNYSVTDWNSAAATVAGWGDIQVQISTDYGVSYTTINTITASANTQTPVSISLAAYAGQNVKFKFLATRTAGDYNVVIDDINAIAPCTAPANQPTNLTFTNVGPGQMTVAYTAAASAPTGYLVVRYPAGDAPTLPVNTTTYTAGIALGTGTVAYVGSNLSNIISGLSVSTNYDFYVYTYNAVTCTSGPVYNTTSPLTGTQSTAGCPTLAATITIGPGADYATLTEAIVILNGCGITQPTVLALQSNYVSTTETFPLILGIISGASAVNTITVRPAVGVSSALTISSSNATGTINHNAGNYFIFDGRPGGTGISKFLTIENTANTGYALNYQNEASNNILRYLTIKGQNTSTTSGTIVFASTTGANGNDNNTVEYNDICAVNATTATPTNGIYASGSTITSATNNNAITISNNNIFDFYSPTAGIDCRGLLVSSGNDGWTISGNSFYQTVSRSYTTQVFMFMNIVFTTHIQPFTINNNYFGGTQPQCGGSALTLTSTTARLAMVLLSTSMTVTSEFNGNTFANVAFNTAATSGLNNCLQVNNGSWNIGASSGNTFGSISQAGSITITTTGTTGSFSTILAGNGTNMGVMNIRNNSISGITIGGAGAMQFLGIRLLSPTNPGTYTIDNNTIGVSSLVNSILNSTNLGIYGIYSAVNTAAVTQTINANTISNLNATSVGSQAEVLGIWTPGTTGGKYQITNNLVNSLNSSGAGAIVAGIYNSAATTNDQLISGNTIHSLVNTGSAASFVYGIYYSGPTAGVNEIKSNLIHSLSASTAASTLTGIQVADAGNALIYNNFIRLGINAAGADIASDLIINGMNQSTTASNHGIYFNSIYVGGAVTSSANNSFAINSTATSGARDIRNNILSNVRTNGAGTGKHYSIKLSGLTGLTINNNDYWTGASFLALNAATDVTTFAGWQTATSQDAGSLSNNPNFATPAGTSATIDLHINISGGSVLESAAANISGISTDRDGDTRPGPTGSVNGGGISSDIGADEFDATPAYSCSTFPALTAVTTNATVCGGTPATLSITGAITGTGITYQWKSSATSLGMYTNVIGATGSTYIVPTISVSNLWYACDVTCANGPLTATTSSVNVQVSACNYTTSLNTGITYSSIMATGSTYSALSSADDGYTNAVPLTATTFKYKGLPITGFVATTNGWMTFNTANTSNTYTNDLTSTGQVNVLAPFWEDLVIKGNLFANKDISMRYQVIGTLGSGTADIIIEWAEMERFSYGDPNINFQVVLHEADNSIDFNYGNFQMFNGATNTINPWTYSIGMNGPTPSTISTDQRIVLQAENKNFFGSTSQNSLGYSIACNSQYRFVPSASFATGSTPTSGSYINSTFVPSNNEVAGAIALSVNGSPCTSNCGNIYSSKNATATSGITACSATTPGTPDDDVFFTFTTSAITNYRIAVDPSAAYNVVVQVLDASQNPVACVNAAGAGLSELITSLALNASSVYYLRIYDAATGATNNGEFAVCISEVIAPPANDEPAGAIALTTGTTCTTTSSILPFTLSATASAGVTSCTAGTPGTADDDIWYSFTTNTIAGTSYAITATGLSTYNAVLQLYSGTVGSLVSVNCVNSTGNGGIETISAGVLPINTTYYLRVYHSGSGAATGNVAICVVHTLPTCLTSTTVATSDYVWQGQTTAWGDASNWLIYNGPSSYSVATVAPSNANNVFIPAATCFSNQPVVIAAASSVNNLTILSGASLALGSYTVGVAGNLTVDGTLNAGTGTINFVGTGPQSVSMGSNEFNNVTMNCSGTVTLSANTIINANYTNTAGSLDMNNFNLAIGGNYTNDNSSASSLIPGTGTVTFNGTGAQAIGGSIATTFTNLTVNKTSGLLTLNKATNVSTLLTMTAGNIATRISVIPDVTNLLTIGTSALNPGLIACPSTPNWSGGTILGPIKRWFAAGINSSQESGIFPVGFTDTNRFAQVNYTATLATGGTITAEYRRGATPVNNVVIPNPPGPDVIYLNYSGLPAYVNGHMVTNYENAGYWEITPGADVDGELGNLNTAQYALILRGNKLSTVSSPAAMSQLRMIKSTTHTSWDNVGIGNYTSNFTLGSDVSDFTITNTEMTGFSFFNIGSGQISWLPIELINFTANCNEKAEVDIKWSTASEQNSEYFNIERSRDLTQWEYVSTLNAAGNSNYNIDYSTLDTDPFGGISYYRLLQVDNNGTQTIYGPISVSCADNENGMVVFPNPTQGNFTVEISSTEMFANAQLQITDLTGKVINERSTNILEGKNQFTFEGLDLQLGTYIIQLNSGNQTIQPVRIVVE
jgi:hypothetical protein